MPKISLVIENKFQLIRLWKWECESIAENWRNANVSEIATMSHIGKPISMAQAFCMYNEQEHPIDSYANITCGNEREQRLLKFASRLNCSITKPKRNKVKSLIHTVKLYSLVLSGEMCLSSIDFSVPYNNVLYDKDDDDIQPEGIRRTNETNYWN